MVQEAMTEENSVDEIETIDEDYGYVGKSTKYFLFASLIHGTYKTSRHQCRRTNSTIY